MIGRIELISARQRELLTQIAAGPVSDRSWFLNWYKANQTAAQAKMADLSLGRATLEDLGMEPRLITGPTWNWGVFVMR